MSELVLTIEEARGLTVDRTAMRLLAPEDVARSAILPLKLTEDGEVATIAADAASRDPDGRILRMLHGVSRVESLRATRETIDYLLENHFLPFWNERGWAFPGLPERNIAGEPVEDPAEAPAEPDRAESAPHAPARVEAVPPAPAMADVEGGSLAPDDLRVFDAPPGPEALSIFDEVESTAKVFDHPPGPEALGIFDEPAASPPAGAVHPTVLLVEKPGKCRDALSVLLQEAGYEARTAATAEDVERELKRSPPRFLAAHRAGPVDEVTLRSLVREGSGRSEVRFVPSFAAALLGTCASDERLPRFLFDITRFFLGVIAASADGCVEKAEARARYAERTARQMGLEAPAIEAVRLAALLADLPGLLARRRPDEAKGPGSDVLASLLDPVRSPFPVGEALMTMAESYDGSGPRELAGEGIPVGGRILAAVERFLSLRQEGLERDEIDARLRDEAGRATDPGVVEALLQADRAERLVERLDRDIDRVVLVEPDSAAASLLRMRLVNAGFGVEVHSEGTGALEAIEASPPALVISEVAVPGTDGFTILLRMKKSETTAEVPFLFVSERVDRGTTVRGLSLGADDFLAKPVDLELLAAKVKSLVRKSRASRPEKASRGVSGDLSEMELMDLLQVLAASARTVRVRVKSQDEPDGEVSLDKGRVVDARVGDAEGVDAFNLLVGRNVGRFRVEAMEPENRTLDAQLESLLLEACRLRDEADLQEAG